MENNNMMAWYLYHCYYYTTYEMICQGFRSKKLHEVLQYFLCKVHKRRGLAKFGESPSLLIFLLFVFNSDDVLTHAHPHVLVQLLLSFFVVTIETA